MELILHVQNKKHFLLLSSQRNEPFIGNDIHNCPNIVPGDRSSLLKSFSLDIKMVAMTTRIPLTVKIHDKAVMSREKNETPLKYVLVS